MKYRSETEFAIIKAYVDLMGEMPYEKVKVKEVAERSGIARSTFYEYFEDALDLVENVEERLLADLSLYRSRSERLGQTVRDMPFESMEHWFDACIAARHTLGALLGKFGDPYFRSRLQNQIRRNLNQMMDDDRAPKDKLRPYYVELLTAAYLGMMGYVISIDDTDKLISTHEMAHIANSTRRAYYRLDENAPRISDETLLGRGDDCES